MHVQQTNVNVIWVSEWVDGWMDRWIDKGEYCKVSSFQIESLVTPQTDASIL